MTNIIPYDLIKHLEWVPGKEPLKPKEELPVEKKPKIISGIYDNTFLESIIAGRAFYNSKLPVALEKALEHAGSDGFVPNLREFIAAKIKAGKEHKFWNEWYGTHTEENIGLDRNGLFYKKNEPVLILVNGGGLLTPDRIKKVYKDGLIDGSAKYCDDEFDNLLAGKLPDGTDIFIYNIEDIISGVPELPHQFAVVMPYEMAKKAESGYHNKKKFLANRLVIARTASLVNLEEYFNLAKASDGTVGNWHPFDGRDASQPQGRVLFVDDDVNGLAGDSGLDGGGRFVGVKAPEAHGGARK